MILSKKQLEELMDATKPSMQFLKDHCNPHCTIIITNGRAELVEGVGQVVLNPPVYPLSTAL